MSDFVGGRIGNEKKIFSLLSGKPREDAEDIWKTYE